VRALVGAGDVVVVFHVLPRAAYYENGGHF
jgi:hypothetical protein